MLIKVKTKIKFKKNAAQLQKFEKLNPESVSFRVGTLGTRWKSSPRMTHQCKSLLAGFWSLKEIHTIMVRTCETL